MADMDYSGENKEFYLDIPVRKEAFFLKGSNALDWGVQDRLARIFQPESGRTVMLANSTTAISRAQPPGLSALT
jgi:putative autoinducer-2 (AI-2) aldolase